MKIILRLVINALVLMLLAYLIPGISVSSFWIALLAALVLGILNALVRPLLIILTLPINILTIGLFTFIINTFLLWLTSAMIGGFEIVSFTSALLGAVLFWLVTIFTNWLIEEE